MQAMQKAIAIVKGLCEEASVAYQIYVNRSDIPGGSTVGSIFIGYATDADDGHWLTIIGYAFRC